MTLPLFKISFSPEDIRTMKRTVSLLLIVFLTSLILQPLSALASGSDPQISIREAASTPEDGKEAVQPFFRSLSPADAAELIDQEKDLLIVDVRTPQERKQFRIADSQLIPVGDVMRGKFSPKADRPVLVICAVGGRSYIAGKVMSARGHQKVYNLEGGIESWRRAGMPIQTGPESRANQ